MRKLLFWSFVFISVKSIAQWSSLAYSVASAAVRMSAIPGSTNIETRAVVTLSGDSVVRGDFNFNATGPIHYMTFRNQEKIIKAKFKPTDTKQISIYMGPRWVIGVPGDSCWYFHIVPGRVNGYSMIPTPRQSHSKISFIQKGKEGPIIKLTKESLLPLIADNPEAVRVAGRRKLKRAIKVYNK